MSYADNAFISMCRDIIENGTSTEGQKVRPHWPDGTPAYTIKKFGVINRYDLSREFPAITLRKTPIKTATDELLWIWQQKSSNIHDLHSGIWDEWADETGSIGKAYGYQLAIKYKYRDIRPEGLIHAFGETEIPETDGTPERITPDMDIFSDARAIRCSDGSYYMDQVDRVIYDLKNEPYSRRIMTSLYNYEDLHAMHLYPCAYSMTFNVTKQPGHDRLTLNTVLNQRSQDILAANAFNVAQYAVLTHMLAQVCDMEAGEFVHVIADAHIYDRHVDIIRELITRTPQPAPKFWLNPEIRDFYQFTRDDVKLTDYQVAGEQIRNIPIAI